jgi:hypothetical protein
MVVVLLIIGVFILVILAQSGNKSSTVSINPNTQRRVQTDTSYKGKSIQDTVKTVKAEVTTPNIPNSDPSIIDVTGQSYRLNTNNTLKKYPNGVPVWAHYYVYSHSEIIGATAEQKSFYAFFKNSFLNGEYYDLEGNNNYAFILLFDLLDRYESQKNIPLLEKQLIILGDCYPRTQSYAKSFLITKMQAAGDSEGVSRLRSVPNNSYQSTYADNDYWKLGDKYKAKLNLTGDEVVLLNKLWHQRNTFSNIEQCLLEILKLYIHTINQLRSRYVQEGTTLEAQFLSVADTIAKKHFRYKTGSNNYKYSIESSTNELYSTIFKHCENAVREQYGHKRKINPETYIATPAVKLELESKVIGKVSEILATSISSIAPPDAATEMELNSQNTSRWKSEFENITNRYINNSEEFIESIKTLAAKNDRNPSVENICFEASKFISKHDKQAALTLYMHYLHYDLKSATFDNKQLTKTIQKSIFKTEEQLDNFQIIVNDFIETKNLEKALDSVSGIFKTKRKKIQLSQTVIEEVQQQHSGTVELLNEYLRDEDENEQIMEVETKQEEIEISIPSNTHASSISIYSEAIGFEKIHIVTLEFFVKNNFTVAQTELGIFAKTKGVFQNQLIERINELCYEELDDILIEEEDEHYIINPNYYQRILRK